MVDRPHDRPTAPDGPEPAPGTSLRAVVDQYGPEFLIQALDALQHPLYLIDAATYRVTAANAAAHERGIVPGGACYALAHGRDVPCDGEDHACPIRLLRGSRKSVVVEHRHRDPDGATRTYEVHSHPILDADGACRQVVEYNLDITERVGEVARREELLEALSERVKELACLYGTSQVVHAAKTPEKILSSVAEALPLAFHFPGCTSARIRFGESEYLSDPFREAGERKVRRLDVHGSEGGTLEVFVVPPEGQPAFLAEEDPLLDGVVKLVSDGVTRLRVQAALDAEREFTRATLDSTAALVLVFDPRGHAVGANAAAQRSLGYTEAELAERPFWELPVASPEERNVLTRVFRNAMATRRPGAYEGDLLDRRGRPFRVAWSYTGLEGKEGAFSHLIATGIDVTERWRAEAFLQRKAEVAERILAGRTMAEILDHIFDSFHTLIPYDRIGYATVEGDQTVRAAWARGVGANLFLKRGYSAPLSAGSLKGVLERGEPRILNDLAGYLEQHPTSEPTRLIVAEGMRSSMTCPLSALGRRVGFLFFSSREAGVYTAVHATHLERLAGHLSLTLEKGRLIQDLERLGAQKNRFLGAAAHDLRHPLAVTQGYLTLFKEGVLGAVTERQLAVLEKVLASCGGMVALIDDLLDVAAIEAGRVELHPEAVPATRLVSEAAERIAFTAEAKGIAVLTEVGEGSAEVRVDPRRMGQVLDNLASNAVKFSPPKSQVAIGCLAEGREVRLFVRDEGPGISSEEMPRLFQEFGRTGALPTGGEKSTGLGLSIAKRLVELHRGRIWVVSRPGEGATFWVGLPLSE